MKKKGVSHKVVSLSSSAWGDKDGTTLNIFKIEFPRILAQASEFQNIYSVRVKYLVHARRI